VIQAIEIGGRQIGNGRPAYVIAEAGVNHNGDPELAIELVKQACAAGADCVKFQTFKAETIVTRGAPKAAYQLKVTDPSESQFEMLKRLELKSDDYGRLFDACKANGIQFLSTPYNFADTDFLEDLGVDGFKIASGQLVELPFLEYTARLGKPMIVSTGMATLGEVDAALTTIRGAGNDKIVLLQCTTNYPSAIEDANVRAMVSMRDSFDVLTGYSDHTQNDYSVYAATALGACLIEKHFTLDPQLTGPDHSCSLTPSQFANMVKGIRDVERALGSPVKRPTVAELANAKGMRRSIVATQRIPAGSTIVSDMLDFKRPASGIEPKMLDRVVGKTARRDIQADAPLTFNDIDW
jgi:N,N'-diacetyllegionaminate synthase